MCGRFALAYTAREIEEALRIKLAKDYQANYNVSPGQNSAVILSEVPQEGLMLRWGLVPAWATDEKVGYKMINARAETLNEKPAWKRLLKARRCLVIASGFFEWKKTKDVKEPYYITTDNVILMAGLWDEWNDLRTFTIITTTPNKAVKSIHDRMPVILAWKEGREWLERGELKLLKPYTESLHVTKVSTLVNNPKNNSPRVLAAL